MSRKSSVLKALPAQPCPSTVGAPHDAPSQAPHRRAAQVPAANASESWLGGELEPALDLRVTGSGRVEVERRLVSPTAPRRPDALQFTLPTSNTDGTRNGSLNVEITKTPLSAGLELRLRRIAADAGVTDWNAQQRMIDEISAHIRPYQSPPDLPGRVVSLRPAGRPNTSWQTYNELCTYDFNGVTPDDTDGIRVAARFVRSFHALKKAGVAAVDLPGVEKVKVAQARLRAHSRMTKRERDAAEARAQPEG